MKSILILTVVIAIAGIIFALIASAIDSSKRNSQPTNSNIYSEYFSENTYSNQTPKIGAQVNESLYNEIQSYCQKHSMTVSDLIRISVKSYMDRN